MDGGSREEGSSRQDGTVWETVGSMTMRSVPEYSTVVRSTKMVGSVLVLMPMLRIVSQDDAKVLTLAISFC